MQPKSLLVAALLLAVPALPTSATSQQTKTAEVLLQEAVHKEIVDGELEAAIKLYRVILDRPASNRSLKAKALFQMGRCYEKFGRAEARGPMKSSCATTGTRWCK